MSNQFNQADKLGPKRIRCQRPEGGPLVESCKIGVLAVSTHPGHPADSDLLKAASKTKQGLGKPLTLSVTLSRHTQTRTR